MHSGLFALKLGHYKSCFLILFSFVIVLLGWGGGIYGGWLSKILPTFVVVCIKNKVLFDGGCNWKNLPLQCPFQNLSTIKCSYLPVAVKCA